MNAVKVKFKNPSYDYVTSVSDSVTEADARKYFVGNRFDLGVFPKEDFQKCIDIEFSKSGISPTLERKKSYREGGSLDEVRDIMKQDYQSFVKLLGENIKDEKFRATIKRLADTAPIKYRNIAVRCESLLPTQNEISLEKSLAFPLTSSYDADRYLAAETPIRIKNRTIITCDNGKYIIDGHHRWSQVYVLNPKAKIDCTDFYELKNPISGLKATQLGVSADLGYVPTKQVKDTNLLTISEKELKEYVNENITPDVVAVFKKHGISNPDEYIWKNVLQLKTRNKPIENASKKDIMPQTDLSDNYSKFTPDVSGTIYPYSYEKGGMVKNWQVKRDSDDRFYSIDPKTGKPKWNDSPDMGYLYDSVEEAEGVIKFLGGSGMSVVPYDKDWWKKMQTGGNTGRAGKMYEVEFRWNKKTEDEYDTRKVNIIAPSLQDAVQKATEMYAKYYDGFEIVEAETEEKYAKGGNIERWQVWQDGREDDFQWSIIVDGVRIQGVLTIKKFSPSYDTQPKVTISDFDYVASSEKVKEIWKKHKDQLLDFVVAEIGRQHVYSLGQKFAKGGSLKKIRVGDRVIPYPSKRELVVDRVFMNKDNEVSYTGKFEGDNTEYEYILNPKDRVYEKEGGSLKKIRVGDRVIPYPSKRELVVDRVFMNKDNEVSYTGKFEGENTEYEYILNPKDRVYEKGGGVAVLPQATRSEIEESIKLGYNRLVVGMIAPNRKGVMLINDNYLVRGVYPLKYKDAIQSIKGVGNYAKGGEVDDSLYGKTVTITKPDYSQATGKVVKLSSQSMNVNLGKGVKGVETDVWVTIIDANGKEHNGTLEGFYAKGGVVEKYKIFVGYDHYKGVPLYQVIGVDNDYVGEYHKDRKDAEKELAELEGKMAKGGKTKLSRSQKEYNKDVDAYKWFVVDLLNKKAVSGWEFKNDAQEALSDYDGDKNYKVYSGRMLKTLGIENPKDTWKYFGGGKTDDLSDRVKKINTDAFNRSIKRELRSIRADAIYGNYKGEEIDREINYTVARKYISYIADKLNFVQGEIDFVNAEKKPTNYFQLEMHTFDEKADVPYIIKSVFVYVGNNHQVVKEQTDVTILDDNYDDVISIHSRSNSYAKGGGVDDSLYGKTVTITKPDYSQATGKVVKLSSQSMNVNLGKGVKGVETDVWVTIIDANGKEHNGTLEGFYAKGGMVNKIDEILDVTLDRWNKKQISNIHKIAKRLKAIDFIEYYSGGGFKHIILLLPNKTVIELTNDNGIVASKNKYSDLENEYLLDDDYKKTGYYPSVEIESDFQNVSEIVSAINNSDNWIYAYAKGGSVKKGMQVELASDINPDDHQRGIVRKPIKSKLQSVDSFEEASRVVNRFISDNDLGGGNWTGGAIYKDGKQVAYVSYNGRVWSGTGDLGSKSKLICESQRDKMAKGGTTKKTSFEDKVQAIKSKLLRNKKVPKAIQKDYGKTFSPAEAEYSAKRIAGAMRKKELSINKK